MSSVSGTAGQSMLISLPEGTIVDQTGARAILEGAAAAHRNRW